jgi:hypothetical protein
VLFNDAHVVATVFICMGGVSGAARVSVNKQKGNMSEAITDEEVMSRAGRWAKLHSDPKLRGRMDKVIEDLSESDQRRVYLLGQRLAGGLSIKIVPATTEAKRKEPNGKKARGRKAATK